MRYAAINNPENGKKKKKERGEGRKKNIYIYMTRTQMKWLGKQDVLYRVKQIISII